VQVKKTISNSQLITKLASPIKLMSYRILITGGAGFVGSTLAIGLKMFNPSWEVVAFDNLRRRGSELNLTRLKAHEINFIHGDIRNSEDFEGIEGVNLLIDASADPSVLSGIDSPVTPLVQANLLGTANCLEFASQQKAAFIFLSTSRIYPIKSLENALFTEKETRFEWLDNQPLRGISSKGVTEDFPLEGSRSFYGATKLASELLITEYNELKGLKTIINRCGVLSGPWQMGKVDQGVLVLWLARHFFKGKLSYIGYGGTGKQTRDVLHVDDLLDLIIHQIQNLDIYNNQTLNVGGGRDISFSLQELTKLCQEVTGNTIEIGSVMENRSADVRLYLSDCSKLQKVCDGNWTPKRDVKQLVADTFEWLKANENQLKNILN
jgi:CDP-paratose 2-epimerase